MKTLLLNAFLIPRRIIPWETAVCMLYKGTADVVAEYGSDISSPSVTWKVPAVIREHRPVKIKHAIRFSRVNVYLRDKFRCQYCGDRFVAKDLTYDHVVSRMHGGKTEWNNVVASCRACNGAKGSKSCDEWGHWPINAPVRPRWLPQAGPPIDVARAPIEWIPYLPA